MHGVKIILICSGRTGYQHFLTLLFALFFSCSCFLEIIHAQSSPPITSSGLNTQVSGPINLPSGETQYNITGGTRPENGPNVFHSFGEFGLPENNIGNFQNDTGLPTSNILGRVTGGNPSSIFGTIQTEGFPGANLFLMNPAGWVFGPNAALNVEGSVNFTTADYLRQSDGSLFMALSPDQDSQLSIAPVAAFGFLEGQPGTITVQGSKLTVDQGQTISLISGNITIESGLNPPEGENPVGSNIGAPGGEVLLASVASAGEILVNTLEQAPNIDGQTFDALGMIQVSEASSIDASGDGGGTVRIRSGRLVIDGSTVSANTTGPAEGPLVGQPGEGIDIQVSQDVLIRDAAVLETNVAATVAPGIGSGGVRIKADRIAILETEPNFEFPFTGIRSNVAPGSLGGPSGDVLLEANSILVKAFGFSTGIETTTFGAGDAGDIILRATGDIDIDNGSLVTLSVFGGGDSGNIELTSTQGNIFIRDTSNFFGFGPFVSVQNPIASSGKAGDITLTASQGDILVSDNASVFTSIGGTAEIEGTGGIEITANNLTVDNTSRIQVDNNTPMVPGGISVNVSEQLSLAGNSNIQTTTRGPARSSDLNITAHDVLVADGSFLSTETFGPGDAGTLNVFTENLQLTEGGQIRSSSTRLDRPNQEGVFVIPSGSGGTINIQGLESPAASVQIEGADSAILTDTQGTGNAGNINILVENLQLTDGGQLRSNSSIGFVPPEQPPFIPTGSGGTINMGNGNPVALVEIEGTGTGIFTDTVGTGDAGSIIVNAIDLTMAAGGGISSGSTLEAADAGDGGIIRINASNSIELNGSTVSTSAVQGKGGDIEIRAGQILQLTNETIVSAESSGAGNSGSITLEAINGDFSSNDSTVSTAAQEAEGGAIVISAGQNVELMNDSTVLAESSGPGDAGAVTLEARGGNFSSEGSTVSTSVTNMKAKAKGGDIAISAGQDVSLNNDTLVSAQSLGLGNAGDVSLTSGNDINMTNSIISTEAAQASGGNIKLSAPNIIQLTDSRIESSVEGGQATEGGNIDLDPVFIIIQNSEILANATAGNGGNITLTATGAVFIDSNSVIDASSETGISGTVRVNSPVAALAEVVAALPKNFVIPKSLFADACAAQAGGQFSSFTQGAPAALPPAPGGFLSSPLMLNNLTTPPSTGGTIQGSTLTQSRLGLDMGLDFSTISLLPAQGCAT